MNSPEEANRNWVDLPRDVTASILWRLGPIDILATAQNVCSSWRSVCNDPSMWRSIQMQYVSDSWIMNYDPERICMRAVEKSAGGLLDISIESFATDDLLKYIADRASNLRSLRLVTCYRVRDEVLAEAAAKMPDLEELELSYCSFSKEAVEAVGRCCPRLRTLKLNSQGYKWPHFECDEDAIAIAKTMPGLVHLQIFGNKLTNDGLQTILDTCQQLKSLDLRQCFNLTLEGGLGIRCAELIEDLRLPYDSTDDYPYRAEILDIISSEGDYPYGFSDIDYLSDDEYYYEFSGGSDFYDYEEFLD